MQPPPDVAGALLAADDALDVPVFLRHSGPLQPARRPSPTRVDTASAPWPASLWPPSGDYLVRTTWRDLLDAATMVGRDPVGWLASVPGLAFAEIMARCAPLFAYLGRHHVGSAPPVASHLRPNVIYTHGTEASAQTVFGYRMGMTMAQWACHGLLRLGPTVHAESATPLDAGSGWSVAAGLPDLVAYRLGFDLPWLIEAKGGRRLGLPKLREGAAQLCRPDLMSGPHVRVLCGTSLEHRVFVTLDIEIIGSPGSEPDPADDGTDPDSLLDLARSRMLYYLLLRETPPTALQITPVGQQVREHRFARAAGAVLLLEHDTSTAHARADAGEPARYRQRPPDERFDMLTARVPGTELILGMSRRLYSACDQLAAAETALTRSVDGDRPAAPLGADEDDFDEFRAEREALYWQRERQQRDDILDQVALAFERGRTAAWQDLIDVSPPVRTRAPVGYLEAATEDTYLAVRGRVVGVPIL